jgi:pimeloyl-ACP methyl ester carboxylesterase
MIAPSLTNHSATATCDTAHVDAFPLSLEDALARFRIDAQRGVCNTGRYECPYFSWGAGPPLVFVHGTADVAQSYVPLAYLLAGHFRCIAYDLPTGRRDRARLETYTHRDLVSDLFALLDHLAVQQTYVLGTSLGSTIALSAAHRRPDRVRRLILQSGFARRPLAPAERFLARIARHLRVMHGSLPFRNAFMRRAAHSPMADDFTSEWQIFESNTGANPARAVAHRVLLLDDIDLRPILPSIQQPTLMICGDHDPVIRRAEEDVLLEGLPRVNRVVLPECGHMAHFTHSGPVAELAKRFLTPPSCNQAGHGCDSPAR